MDGVEADEEDTVENWLFYAEKCFQTRRQCSYEAFYAKTQEHLHYVEGPGGLQPDSFSDVPSKSRVILTLRRENGI